MSPQSIPVGYSRKIDCRNSLFKSEGCANVYDSDMCMFVLRRSTPMRHKAITASAIATRLDVYSGGDWPRPQSGKSPLKPAQTAVASHRDLSAVAIVSYFVSSPSFSVERSNLVARLLGLEHGWSLILIVVCCSLTASNASGRRRRTSLVSRTTRCDELLSRDDTFFINYRRTHSRATHLILVYTIVDRSHTSAHSRKLARLAAAFPFADCTRIIVYVDIII